jgi:hypothetical protein
MEEGGKRSRDRTGGKGGTKFRRKNNNRKIRRDG